MLFLARTCYNCKPYFKDPKVLWCSGSKTILLWNPAKIWGMSGLLCKRVFLQLGLFSIWLTTECANCFYGKALHCEVMLSDGSLRDRAWVCELGQSNTIMQTMPNLLTSTPQLLFIWMGTPLLYPNAAALGVLCPKAAFRPLDCSVHHPICP